VDDAPLPAEKQCRAWECCDLLLHDYNDRLSDADRDRLAGLWRIEPGAWSRQQCGFATGLYIVVTKGQA
jgi:CxxC motif-containing protein (DUF1111 family)